MILAVAALGMIGFFLYQEYRMPHTADLLKEAAEQLEAENYSAAAEQLEAAIVNEQKLKEKGKETIMENGAPYITEAYRGLGMIAYSKQEYEQARVNLLKTIELGGEETPVLYHMLGISAMKLEDYDGALEAFAAGTALPEEGTYKRTDGAEETADYSEVIREMKWNRIACFEKKLDWESAGVEAEAYVMASPEDTAAAKEAEFLATR